MRMKTDSDDDSNIEEEMKQLAMFSLKFGMIWAKEKDKVMDFEKMEDKVITNNSYTHTL